MIYTSLLYALSRTSSLLLAILLLSALSLNALSRALGAGFAILARSYPLWLLITTLAADLALLTNGKSTNVSFLVHHAEDLHVAALFSSAIDLKLSQMLVALLLFFFLRLGSIWFSLKLLVEFTDRCSSHLRHSQRFHQSFVLTLA